MAIDNNFSPTLTGEEPKNLKKKDLMERCSISSASVAKLTKGDNITTDVLLRICKGLDCDFADIMQVIPDEKPGEKET